MSNVSDLRAYLKPSGSNPEIDGLYYELASQEKIHGMWNCRVLSLGFDKGEFIRGMIFQPINPTKPIVFAIDGIQDGCYFTVVDGHMLRWHILAGMHNFSPFRTDQLLIDCSGGSGIEKRMTYWSIKTGGETFVHSPETSFPGTWAVGDCDLLCALVAGELGANQLRATVYKIKRKSVKEGKGMRRIKELNKEVLSLTNELGKTTSHLNFLTGNLEGMVKGSWPFIGKRRIKDILHILNYIDFMQNTMKG